MGAEGYAVPQLPPGTSKALLKLLKPDWLTREGVELAAVSRSLPARGTLSRTFCECGPVLQQSVPVWGRPSVPVLFSGIDARGCGWRDAQHHAGPFLPRVSS